MVNDVAALSPIIGGLAAALIGIVLFILALLIAIYVYSALALMTIAKKTNTPNSWFAWIPILNIYLMMKIADARLWTFIAFLIAGLIPIIGSYLDINQIPYQTFAVISWLISLIPIAVMMTWWWGIAQERDKSGILGILMVVPVVNLVIIGYLAWSR